MAKAKQVPAKVDVRTKVAIWLLIAPTALMIVSFALFPLANWALYAVNNGGSTPVSVTINIFLWLFAVIGIIAWLPSLITGIIILTTKKDHAKN